MAKAKRRPASRIDWREYPAPDDMRSGCKVSWHTYRDRAAAEACAEAARHNAVRKAGLGYDFGYCCPGSIEKLNDGRFEVCLP